MVLYLYIALYLYGLDVFKDNCHSQKWLQQGANYGATVIEDALLCLNKERMGYFLLYSQCLVHSCLAFNCLAYFSFHCEGRYGR